MNKFKVIILTSIVLLATLISACGEEPKSESASSEEISIVSEASAESEESEISEEPSDIFLSEEPSEDAVSLPFIPFD